MCAAEAGKRGRRVWLIDHAKKIGEKIRISGGGRCNFTNIHTRPATFLSANKHFCKSALSQYTQHNFIALVEKHGIAYHEKKLGQLFCDGSAQQIIDMLRKECDDAGVVLESETSVSQIEEIKDAQGSEARYVVHTERGVHDCQSLVIATGGLSIPKIGASRFGYDIAKQFDLDVIDTHAALVPLTFQSDFLERCKALAGLSVEAKVTYGKTSFAEGLLFTHRGLSGPSILQISSYWHEGHDLTVNLAPETDMEALFLSRKQTNPKQEIQTILGEVLPKRLADSLCDMHGIGGRLADLSDKKINTLAAHINDWHVRPSGNEGYRTAEVTLGGVNTDALSSKTMEVKKQPDLYFIGEVVDVTGHLGGFNFQWAWSSGYVCGQYV